MADYEELRALSEAITYDTVMDYFDNTNQATTKASVVIVRASVIFTKHLGRAMREKDPRKQIKILKRARQDAQAMKVIASKIPDDNIHDHIWRLCNNTWWKSIYKYGKVAIDSEEDLNNMTRQATIKKFDWVIKYLDLEIEYCERKLGS